MKSNQSAEYFTETDVNGDSFYITSKRMYRVLKGLKKEYEEKEKDLNKREIWEDDDTLRILINQVTAQLQILESIFRDAQLIKL